MKTLRPAALATLLLAGVAAAALFDFDVRSALDLKVTLGQPAWIDGSVKLAPGAYDVHLTTAADGAVRASFLQRGVKRGEAHGFIVVQRAGSAKVQTFQSLGIGPTSPSTHRTTGPKPSLEIGSPGSNQVIVWLQPPPAGKQ
jgi:hypothetical protein